MVMIFMFINYFVFKVSWGGGALNSVRPSVVFCIILKKYWGNPYLKIIDFSKLFVPQSTFGTPITKIFKIILL